MVGRDYRIGDSKVLESRELGDGKTIRRRRETLDGKCRFTTYERIERPDLSVIKKNSKRELFDREKLARAISQSVGKFFTSEIEVEQIINETEEAIYNLGETEVLSSAIGDIVLDILAKKNEIAFYIVGHITKDGKLAGPKLLEHMVDAVLQLEGEENSYYRIIRSIKNRYGSTNEISIFDMKENGISEVKNPSEFFISDREEKNIGSIITPIFEGSRVFLYEIQSLLSTPNFGIPRRTVEGYDKNRVEILSAVLSRHLNLDVSSKDIYINVPGGIDLNDRSSDLAVVFSLLSSINKIPISQKIAAIGELGLRGEVRKVSFIKNRVTELEKLGFVGVYVPMSHKKDLENEKLKIKINYISNISELVERVR